MANYGFGITAVQINKLIGGEWSDETRLNCYMAASIADLPDATAYAKFTAILNTLGIMFASKTKIADLQYVETFAYGGKLEKKLTEKEMRIAIAQSMWPDMDSAISSQMIKDIKGSALTAMYDKLLASKKNDNVKFVLHRIVIGQNTVYRICPDGQDVLTIAGEAINYLAKAK